MSPPPACLGAPDDWGPFLALVSSQKCGLGEPRAAAAGAVVPVGEDPVHWHCVVEEPLEDPLGMDTGELLLGQKGTMFGFWVHN